MENVDRIWLICNQHTNGGDWWGFTLVVGDGSVLMDCCHAGSGGAAVEMEKRDGEDAN